MTRRSHRTLAFPGAVVYAGTAQDVAAVCTHIADHVDSQPLQRRLVLGFDMEWQHSPERPPALIQLCVRHAHCPPISLPLQPQPAQAPQHTGAQAGHTQTVEDDGVTCYLLHLARLGLDGPSRCTPELQRLLEHPRVFLVTAGDRDEEKLEHDLGIRPANLEQVNMMHFLLKAAEKEEAERKNGVAEGAAGVVGPRPKKKQRTQQSKAEIISLAAMVGLYLGMRLDKAGQLANEAWEAPELSAQCQAYACTDAWAQVLVFEAIKARLKELAARRAAPQ